MFGEGRGGRGRGGGEGEPVGLRASEESIVTISLGDMRRGMAWRESHAAVLVA